MKWSNSNISLDKLLKKIRGRILTMFIIAALLENIQGSNILYIYF